MDKEFASQRDFAPERRDTHALPELSPEVLETRLKSDTWQATIHGKKAARALGGFAVVIGLSAAISYSGCEPGQTTTTSMDAPDRTYELPAPIDAPVTTLDASGLDPAAYSQQITHFVGPYSNADALNMARNVAQMTAGGNPAVAVNFYNQDFCLLYHEKDAGQGYENLHEILDAGAPFPSSFLQSRFSRMSDEAATRHAGLAKALVGNDDSRHILLHELQHCYIGQAIHQIQDHLEEGRDIDEMGLVEEKYELARYISQVYSDAEELAGKHPHLERGKLIEVILSQLEESVADVFASLALHQGDAPQLLRQRIERLVMFRDLERQVGSTHDSVNALLSMLKGASEIGRAVEHSATAISWASEGEAAIAEVNQNGFEALSKLALRQTVTTMGPPIEKMRQVHFFEIVDNHQANLDQSRTWGVSRMLFAANKPQGEQLDKIRQRLLDRAEIDETTPRP